MLVGSFFFLFHPLPSFIWPFSFPIMYSASFVVAFAGVATALNNGVGKLPKMGYDSKRALRGLGDSLICAGKLSMLSPATTTEAMCLLRLNQWQNLAS